LSLTLILKIRRSAYWNGFNRIQASPRWIQPNDHLVIAVLTLITGAAVEAVVDWDNKDLVVWALLVLEVGKAVDAALLKPLQQY
jgi:hypothetical protein